MIYRYFFKLKICLFAAFFFAIFNGCATTKIVFDKPETSPALRNDESIILMPHQQKVINYLQDNPEVKGILINHYMGTGKTFLALGFAEINQHDQVIILAPSYLKNSWHQQMNDFQVKDQKRYTFLSFENAIKNINPNMFVDKILIIDEAHNFIKHLNSDDEKQNESFARLFEEARLAKRILGLTGTPIYQDVSDIALLLNLVSGKDLLTFSREQFRVNYSKKMPVRSFWRGKLFESNIIYITLPVFFSFLSFALFATPLAIIPGVALGASVIPLVNNVAAPLTHYHLREGNYGELIPHIEKHLSYFRFENPSSEDFPSQSIIEKSVPYNTAQMDFFLRYREEDLNAEELTEILKEKQPLINPSYVAVDLSRINKNLKLKPGNGREIGNLSIPNNDNVSPKFISLVKEINNSPGKVAIYSNYYHNGIKKFYDYLCSINMCDQAVIIDPSESDALQAQKIAAYNQDKKRIILFTFTEGVSLFKTRQLHILEPVLNQAILEQVIGRAVRYRSHASLKEAERHVDVYLWQSTLPSWDWASYQLKRQNWRLRYGELSQHSNWGSGISQLDKNYYQKLSSPDQQCVLDLEKLKRDSAQIIQTIKENSIETVVEAKH